MAKIDGDTEVLDIDDSCDGIGTDEVNDSEEAVVLDTDDDNDDVASFRSGSFSGSACTRWRSGSLRRGVYAVCAPTPSPKGSAAVTNMDNLRSFVSGSTCSDPFSQKQLGIRDEFSSERSNGHINDVDNKTKKIQVLSKLPSTNMDEDKKIIETKSVPLGDDKGSMLHSNAEPENVKLRDTESQESEDLSQAKALGFVDHYLSLNSMHLLEKDAPGRTSRPKSLPVSCAKGSQKLARRATVGTSCGLSRTFEWDDDLDGSMPSSVTRRPEDQKFLKDKMFTEFSNPVVENYKAIDEVGRVSQKKVKEIDDELNEERPLQIEAGNIGENVPDAYDVGFDTQMAAEAMEALFYASPAVGHAHPDLGDTIGDSSVGSEPNSSSGIAARKLKEKNGSSKKLNRQRSRFTEMNQKVLDPELLESKSGSKKKQWKAHTKTNSNSVCPINVSVHSCNSSVTLTEQGKKAKDLGRYNINNVDEDLIALTSGEHKSRKRVPLQTKNMNLSPVVCRTRYPSSVLLKKETKDKINSFAEKINADIELGILKKRKRFEHAEMPQLSTTTRKRSKIFFLASEGAGNVKASQKQQKIASLGQLGCNLKFDIWSFPKGKRKPRKARHQLNGLIFLDRSTMVKAVTVPCSSTGSPRRKPRQLAHDHQVQSSVVLSCEDPLRHKSEVQSSTYVFDRGFSAANKKMTVPRQDFLDASSLCGNVDSVGPTSPAMGTNKLLEKQPQNVNTISGGSNNVHKVRDKRWLRVPLMKELFSLNISGSSLANESKHPRRRKDMKDVRVLFSQNMNDTLIKKQKKILERLGSSFASSCLEATHFVADRFVRTRNMLETIALGKPVVTHLWLVSCGQAKFLVDEKNYVLRDAKKEKEIGFSMPASLANAKKAPLLQGRRVFVTPNINPGRELIVSLVKAVHGEVWPEAEDRFREAVKSETIPDDLIILSCEQDHVFCASFLKQGAAIYSSELLLNGIVIQKLEFERHRLFKNLLQI